jgi:uncharacterized protein DUF4352
VETADDPGSEARGRRNLRIIQGLACAVVLILVWFAIARPSGEGPSDRPSALAPTSEPSGFDPSTVVPSPSVAEVVAQAGAVAHGERLDLEIQYFGLALPSPDNPSNPTTCGLEPLPGAQLGNVYLFSVTLTNHSNSSVAFARSRFSIIDRSHRRGPPADLPGLPAEPLFAGRGDIPPGGSVDGFVFFDAARMAAPIKVSYMDDRQELSVLGC